MSKLVQKLRTKILLLIFWYEKLKYGNKGNLNHCVKDSIRIATNWESSRYNLEYYRFFKKKLTMLFVIHVFLLIDTFWQTLKEICQHKLLASNWGGRVTMAFSMLESSSRLRSWFSGSDAFFVTSKLVQTCWNLILEFLVEETKTKTVAVAQWQLLKERPFFVRYFLLRWEDWIPFCGSGWALAWRNVTVSARSHPPSTLLPL